MRILFAFEPSAMSCSLHLAHHYVCIGSVIVRCSQTGKQHAVKVGDLSKEDCSPLNEKDLTKGSSLMLDYKGKPYPVTFVQFKGLLCIYSSLQDLYLYLLHVRAL